MTRIRTWRACALAVVLGSPTASTAEILSDLTLLYREDFAGETASPTTPEVNRLDIGGIAAFKQFGNGIPSIAYGDAMLALGVDATAGLAPLEQVGASALPSFPDEITVGVRAVLRDFDPVVNGDALLYAGPYLASASAGLSASLQRLSALGSDLLYVVVAELDLVLGSQRPFRSQALDATATAAIAAGAPVTVELRYDRNAESARGWLGVDGSEFETAPITPTLLDGELLPFAGAAVGAVNVFGTNDFGRDDSLDVNVDEVALLPEPVSAAVSGLVALGLLSVAAWARRRVGVGQRGA